MMRFLNYLGKNRHQGEVAEEERNETTPNQENTQRGGNSIITWERVAKTLIVLTEENLTI